MQTAVLGHSFVHSLAPLTRLLAPSLVGKWMIRWLFILFFFDVALSAVVSSSSTGPLIISSSEKERNHFQNRRYAEFNPALHLASWGWKNNRTHGKKINIVAHASHPSFAFDAADAKQK